MEQPVFNPFASKLQWAFGLFPAVALTCFYSFVIRSRLELGHWPTYDHPDPKLLGFELHYSLVWLLLMLTPVLGLMAVIFSVRALVVPLRLPWWKALLPVVVPFGAAFIIILTDPGGFFGWLAD
jgi:hypothetical protein